MRLETESLEMVCATAQMVAAEIESRQALGELLGAEVPDSWPPGEYDRDAQEFFLAQLQAGGEVTEGWLTWYGLYRRDEGLPVLIGAAGYFGPPGAGSEEGKEGEVEIGYSVVPEWRGRGFASEMAAALTERALADSRVQVVAAHVSPKNEASHGVLRRAGFTFVKTEEDGMWRFEKRRSEQTNTA